MSLSILFPIFYHDELYSNLLESSEFCLISGTVTLSQENDVPSLYAALSYTAKAR